MKTKRLISASIFILAVQIFSMAQTFDLSNLIEDAKKNAVTSAKSFYLEFGSDWKRTVDRGNGKSYSQTFELVCSNKHCEHIQVEQDGKNFSEKKVRKNREKAAKNIIKSEATIESKSNKTIGQYGYHFLIGTAFSPKINSSFSPFMYLNICKTDFLEKQLIENRPTIKAHSHDCNVSNEIEKEIFLFMPKTEAIIWIDEADKAIVKTEIYGKQRAETAVNFKQPLVVMETAKVSQGGWFWKKITINANGNEYFFPINYGNWQIDFFNYKKFNVDINKAEIDKKQN